MKCSSVFTSGFGTIAFCCAVCTVGCLKSASQTNDFRVGSDLVIDDNFVTQATAALIQGALSNGCLDFGFAPLVNEQCSNAFARLTEFLDIRAATNADNSGFVFLYSELKKNINSTDGKQYLQSLSSKVSEVITSGEKLQLWEFTLAFCKGDVPRAISYLASFFQDTLPTQAQIFWLNNTGDGDSTALSQLLADLDFLSKKNLVDFYPHGVESSRQALYHFYIPMYFSNKMKFHFTKQNMALLTAFLFNARYEFRQIWENKHPEDKVNYKVKGGIARRKALIDDLVAHMSGKILPFDPVGESGNFEDLYLGYAGASMGIDNSFSQEKSSSFRKSFAQDPMAFIKQKF